MMVFHLLFHLLLIYIRQANTNTLSSSNQINKPIFDLDKNSLIDNRIISKSFPFTLYNSDNNNICPDQTYEESGQCYNCQCFNKANCNKAHICNCLPSDVYSGNFCQIQNISDNALRFIVSENPILTENTHITFKAIPMKKYDVIWYLDFKSDNSCFNSLYEDELVIRKGCFKNDYSNTISLNVYDINANIHYQNHMWIKVNNKKHNDLIDAKITYPSGRNDVRPMEDLIHIQIERSQRVLNIDNLYFSLTYLDKYGNELSITSFSNRLTIETVLPYLEEVNIYVRSDIGETYLWITKQVSVFKQPFYEVSIDNILKERVSNGIKIKKLMHYCQFGMIMFSKEQLEIVKDIIITTAKRLIENSLSIELNNYKIANDNEYIDLDIIFSFLNHIIHFHNDKTKIGSNCNKECALIFIDELILKLLLDINAHSLFKISLESLKSIFRDIDTLLRFDTNKENILSDFNAILKQSLNHLRECISRQIYQGEQLNLIGQNVAMFFDRPGLNQTSVSIALFDFIETTDLLSGYKLSYKGKQDNCTITDCLICIAFDNYDHLKVEIEQILNMHMKQSIIGVTVLKVNEGQLKPDYNAITNNEVYVNMYSLNSKSSFQPKFLKYGLSFSVKDNLSIESAKDRSTIACISNPITSSISAAASMCNTFFIESRILCLCYTSNYITVISNKAYSDESKANQYKLPPIQYFNLLSLPLIYSTAILVILSSILLLFYDIYQDKKNFRLRHLSEFELRHLIFKEINHLNSAHKFFFALCMTYYQYPFVDVFSQYSHSNPRIIRFFKEIIIMLVSLFLCLIPFSFGEFTKKREMIDNREYSLRYLKVDYLSAEFSDINRSFWMSFGINLVVRLCSHISFSKTINHAHMKQQIWNPIKNKFKEYIYNDVKKDILLNDNWQKIKIRILAINNLCGKYINSNRNGQQASNDKAGRYLRYKRNNEIESDGITYFHNSASQYKKEALFDDRKSYQTVELDSHTLKQLNRSTDVFPLFPQKDSINNANHSEVITNLQPDAKMQRSLCKRQLKYSFYLSKNKKQLVSQHTALRFKAIAKNYIYTPNQVFNMTIDTCKDSTISRLTYNGNDMFTVERQGCYSYYSDIEAKRVDHVMENRSKLTKTLIAFGILIVTLLIIYGSSSLLLKMAFEEYRFYLINVWLLPCLGQIILFGFIMHYAMCLIATFLIFNLRQKKKNNKLISLLYKVFVEKYMIDMFKLRNIFTKYHKEFEEEIKT